MSEEIPPNSNGDGGDQWKRDQKGRFGPGNKGGPGNPRSQTARQLSDRIIEAANDIFSPHRVRNMLDSVMTNAEKGNEASVKIVMEYIDGPVGMKNLNDRLAAIEDALQLTEREPQV